MEKPLYNICKKAGSSLGRVTRESTRLKLKQGWLIRNFKNKANGMSFSEFVLDLPPPPHYYFFVKKIIRQEGGGWSPGRSPPGDLQEKRLQQSNLKAAKLKARLLRLQYEKEKKISIDTRLKILNSSPTAQPVNVTDLESNTTITYPSASPLVPVLRKHRTREPRKAALALNASNSTIMNKLNGKNTRPYKNRFLITQPST